MWDVNCQDSSDYGQAVAFQCLNIVHIQYTYMLHLKSSLQTDMLTFVHILIVTHINCCTIAMHIYVTCLNILRLLC